MLGRAPPFRWRARSSRRRTALPPQRRRESAAANSSDRLGFMQHKAGFVWINDHDLLYLLVQLHPLGTLEAEHDVLGRERAAIVKLHALAQVEFVGAMILALRPGFGEARRHVVPRHRLH